MAELVDAPDSKSGGGDTVSVRFRPSVPTGYSLLFVLQDMRRTGAGIANRLALHAAIYLSLISTVPVPQTMGPACLLRRVMSLWLGVHAGMAVVFCLKQDAHTQALHSIRPELEQFARQHTGVLLEDKGFTLSLRYRMAPTLQPAAPDCRRMA